ncbi:amino acid racemase [Vagococcus coleopterorum]|uniref:Amino acid racemase n=1 Tax=Vagococcus coleopterorum TaxID=2714946 RepID=A0A6G8ANG7_9ENTE|nr:amino acid racemase [Vagococcus coleopterorum]QIL46618.1 amino acid racemase [Vagococcus coleopterorum]
MKNFFTILGGMGTLASESFVRVLNERTVAKTDQDYLNYILVNHAKIPDRTAYILGKSTESPVAALMEDLKQQDQLNPDFFVLTCNTAHTFYEELTAVTETPIFHMPRLAAETVQANYKKKGEAVKVCLLATLGTVDSGVYAKEFESVEGYDLVLPDEDLQQEVMNLIYRDIKEHKFLNESLFKDILEQVTTTLGCDVAILGCTELSLMNEVTKHRYPVVDAQSVLIDETIKQAKK